MSFFFLLRTISLRRLFGAPLRSGLTALGIAAGVGLMVAVGATNDALLAAFRTTLEAVGGGSDLQASGGPGGLAEDAADLARAVPGVKTAVPAIVEVTRLPGGGDLLIMGVDMAGGDAVRDLDAWEAGGGGSTLPPAQEPEAEFDPLVFLNDPDAILVSKSFAEKKGLKIGSRIDVSASAGVRSLHVRGLIRAKVAASAFGGDVAVMDLYTAQSAFARGKRIDRVDIDLAPGADRDQVAAAVRAAIGPGTTVEPPDRRQQPVEKMLKPFQAALGMGSFLALIVGMFLVYNTVSFSVVRRRREIGTLRAMGLSRREVTAMFTLEAAVLAAFGSAAGVLLGIALSGGAVRAVTKAITSAYVRVAASEARMTFETIAFAVFMGVVCAMIAALRPAMNAARIHPVEALARATEPPHTPVTAWTYLRGVTVAILGIALTSWDSPWASYTGNLGLGAVALGGALFAWPAVDATRRIVGPLVKRLFGAPGRIAVDALAKNPGRSAVGAGALMIGLAMTMCVGIWVQSFHTTLQSWINGTIPADLFMAQANKLVGVENMPMDGSLFPHIAALDGVKAVDKVRIGFSEQRGSRLALVSADANVYFRHAKMTVLEGEEDSEELRALTVGGAVLPNETLMRKWNVHAGGTILLETAEGPVEFPVPAIVVDYTGDQGTVVMHRDVYVKHWKDERVDSFDVYLHQGADALAVRGEIQKRWGASHNLFVLTNAELRAEITKLVDDFFGMTYALLVIAIIVGLLGIANTLLAQVVDRTREIGILRACGASRGQIMGSITLEALLLALAGALLGLAVGAVMGWMFVDYLGVYTTGWLIPFAFPVALAAASSLTAIGASIAASLFPARLAAGLDIVEAISYE